jgi:hypothetical protein
LAFATAISAFACTQAIETLLLLVNDAMRLRIKFLALLLKDLLAVFLMLLQRFLYKATPTAHAALNQLPLNLCILLHRWGNLNTRGFCHFAIMISFCHTVAGKAFFALQANILLGVSVPCAAPLLLRILV